MKNVNKIKISPDEIYGVGQDKKNWFPAWNVLDDKSLYEKVNKLARSTFDKSKFTVVGSPTITDDGIASGFSSGTSGNHLKLPSNIRIYGNNWEIRGKVDLTSHIGGTILNQQPTDAIFSESRIGITNWNSGRFYLFCGNGTNTQSFSGNITHSGVVYFKIGRNNNIYYIKTSINNIDYITENTQSVQYDADANYLALGASVASSFGGSIDLKHFSITVDGKEVFSGNKTGLDVIKPDNYTVVGSPVISDDGVASGFSSSNYIQTSINLNNSKPFKYELSFKTSTISNTTGAIVGTAWNYAHVKTEGNQCRFYYNSDYYVGFIVASNTSYDIIAEYDGNTTIKLYYRQSSKNEYNLTQNQNVVQGSNTSMVRISHWDDSMPQPFNGSIDLNSFKIYVDGNLVYQPCLKIPYTQAKLNHKVVDAAYRDRVIDLLEQFGYNGYHTMDEDSENFTLPTHNFDDIIDCYEGEGGSWEQTVGQIIKQQGLEAKTGVEVTLLKPYKDADSYALSIPYTNKTASSFVPAADGDWFAKGKVVL